MPAENLLYMRIKRYLEQLIEQNRNDSQYMLPSEKQLSLRFGCSRIPAKRALEELKSEGLIYRVQGRGSFISTHNNGVHLMKKSVCLLIPNLTMQFTTDIIHAVQQYLRQKEVNLFISTTYDISEMEAQMIDAIVSKQFDGLIIFPVVYENFNKTLLNLVVRKYPIVFVGRNIPGLKASCISCDHYVQTKAAMKFLIKEGHQRIGFITENAKSSYCYEERIRAYRHYMEQCRQPSALCEIDFFSDIENEATRHQIEKSIIRFLDENPRITALLTTTHAVATICDYFRENPKRFKHLTVMVFDRPEKFSVYEQQKWLFIDQQPYKMGLIAAEHIVDQIISHSPPQQIIIESKIIPINMDSALL